MAQYIGTIANSLNQVTIDRHNDPPFALTRMPRNLTIGGASEYACFLPHNWGAMAMAGCQHLRAEYRVVARRRPRRQSRERGADACAAGRLSGGECRPPWSRRRLKLCRPSPRQCQRCAATNDITRSRTVGSECAAGGAMSMSARDRTTLALGLTIAAKRSGAMRYHQRTWPAAMAGGRFTPTPIYTTFKLLD